MPAPFLTASDVGAVVMSSATTFDSQGDVTISVGDLVVACGASGDPTDTISFSGGGMTWTERVTSPGFNAIVSIWTATATTNDAVVLTMNRSGNQPYGHCATFYVFSGSGGPGDSCSDSQVGGSPSGTITTTTQDSAIVAMSTDGGDNNTAATWLTNADTFNSYQDDISTSFEVHTGYHDDAGAIGSYSVGQSLPSSQYYEFAALEVKSSPDGATTAWIVA